jgi:hypothetical protein
MLVVGIVMTLLGTPNVMPMMDDFNHVFVGGMSALYFIIISHNGINLRILDYSSSYSNLQFTSPQNWRNQIRT